MAGAEPGTVTDAMAGAAVRVVAPLPHALTKRYNSLWSDLRRDFVRFVTVLSQRTRSVPAMPMSFPSSGTWRLKILARDNRFVFGVYRRHMKVIGSLGTFDRLFGVPVTTRNWNTMTAIARVLGKGGA